MLPTCSSLQSSVISIRFDCRKSLWNSYQWFHAIWLPLFFCLERPCVYIDWPSIYTSMIEFYYSFYLSDSSVLVVLQCAVQTYNGREIVKISCLEVWIRDTWGFNWGHTKKETVLEILVYQLGFFFLQRVNWLGFSHVKAKFSNKRVILFPSRVNRIRHKFYQEEWVQSHV